MNPYAPPTADVNMTHPTQRKKVAWLVVGLSVLQLLWLLFWLSGYWELVRTGAAGSATALSGFAGCILLYVGAARFAAHAARGNRLFIAALVCLVWSGRGWDLHYPWSYPYVFGAAVAAVGWWLSRGRAASEQIKG